MKYNLIVITGPTASGKTSLAVKLADILNTEIISADSRQVYRGMDIGTGKDLEEYNINNRTIPYHLIDVVDPLEDFNLFQFYKSFFELFNEFSKNGKIPLLAGGTPLYIHSVIAGYNLPEVPVNHGLREKLKNYTKKNLIEYLKSLQSEIHNTTDFETEERLLRAIEIATFHLENPGARTPGKDISLKPFILGTLWDREVLRKRIKKRLLERLEKGMVEEVNNLHKNGCSWERLEHFGLEYKYIALYLQNKITYREMTDTLYTKICQFAKRQHTWFRKIERQGFKINWVEEADFDICRQLLKDSFSFLL